MSIIILENDKLISLKDFVFCLKVDIKDIPYCKEMVKELPLYEIDNNEYFKLSDYRNKILSDNLKVKNFYTFQ